MTETRSRVLDAAIIPITRMTHTKKTNFPKWMRDFYQNSKAVPSNKNNSFHCSRPVSFISMNDYECSTKTRLPANNYYNLLWLAKSFNVARLIFFRSLALSLSISLCLSLSLSLSLSSLFQPLHRAYRLFHFNVYYFFLFRVMCYKSLRKFLTQYS